MSLGTRLTLKTAVLVLAVVVVAGVALWGLGGLNRDLDEALGEYDKLKDLYILSNQVKVAQAAYRGMPEYLNPPEHEHKVNSIRGTIVRVDQLEDAFEPQRHVQIKQALDEVLLRLEQDVPGENRYRQAGMMLYPPLGLLSAEIGDRNERIRQIQQDAQARRDKVQFLVGLTALIAALLAVAVGVWQYMAVMNPLRRLQRGVRLLAKGHFDRGLAATGDREFVALANDFNRMAGELHSLYQDLEDKVRLRSAQLAQSERLASVGFLAAGVAHEINNPLAIIAGEAELALGALPKDADPDLRQALTTTRDEAFRCKGITQKLLSLARPGSGTRIATDLKPLAEEVASLVKTLPQHEGRAVVVQGSTANAQTDTAQIKQVLLNLVINALEAVPAETGRVWLEVGQRVGHASIAVRDNGKGLDSDALARVFEPFYTEKKSPTTPGLGLGLSISHAIIEDLGGTLTATSPGPDQGSTFTIELPTA